MVAATTANPTIAKMDKQSGVWSPLDPLAVGLSKDNKMSYSVRKRGHRSRIKVSFGIDLMIKNAHDCGWMFEDSHRECTVRRSGVCVCSMNGSVGEDASRVFRRSGCVCLLHEEECGCRCVLCVCVYGTVDEGVCVCMYVCVCACTRMGASVWMKVCVCV